MRVKRIEGEFSICKIEKLSDVRAGGKFFFLGKTDEELSLVCHTRDVPAHVVIRDDDWRCFRIQGVLDFSLIGILSKISTLLAEKNIGIFAVSTFNTDYILTKADDFQRAVEVLQTNGYPFEEESL